MKLILKNFRCYEDKTFDFNDEGMVLLSGQSGAGKSTILMAINFVLYGAGTKVTTHGKTSCSVTMEFDDAVISRTKRPNRLVVTIDESVYEDEPAQAIVNEKFGSAFDIISYVQQNAVNSFVLMSPTDKLLFLEKFAFAGVNLPDIKKRCQAMVKQRNEALIAVSSNFSMVKSHLSTLEKPKRVPFPLKNSLDKEKAIKNESIRLKNTLTLIKREEKTMEYLRTARENLSIFEATFKAKTSQLKTAEQSLQKIDQELNDTKTEPEVLQHLQDEIKIILAQKNYTQAKNSLEKLERDSEKEATKIRSILWKDYSREEIDELVSDQEMLVKDLEKLAELSDVLTNTRVDDKLLDSDKKKLDTMKEEHSRLQHQQDLLTCPSCNASLRLVENSLTLSDVSADENVEEKLSQLSKNIIAMEKTIFSRSRNLTLFRDAKKKYDAITEKYEFVSPPNLEEETQNLTQLKKYRKEQKILEEKLDNILSGHAIKNLRQQVQELKTDFRENTRDEEDVRQDIEKEKIKNDAFCRLSKQKKEITITLEKLQKDIDELVQKKPEKTLQEIEQEIKRSQDTTIELKDKLSIHEKNMLLVEEWKKYTENKERFSEWETKAQTLESEEKSAKDKLVAVTTLKDKILQAESIAVLNIVENLNNVAQEFIDIFFTADPLVVKLSTFKTAKKANAVAKPQLNMTVEYRGMEGDTSLLSGGELSRVILAYTLALSEIFGSPLIMLDESTASLDSELSETVFDGIKERFNNRLVLVVAHQCVSGTFNQVVNVRN